MRIVHVFRAPLGGLFRHVVDLAGEQVRRGHEVALFFDASGDCEPVRRRLSSIPLLAVGTTPIHRGLHGQDLLSLRAFSRFVEEIEPDVVHGHGAKGGVLARLGGSGPNLVRVYTPHGGSFGCNWGRVKKAVYMGLERILALRTDLFLWESAYARRVFDTHITHIKSSTLSCLARNGLREEEFVPVTPAADAADIVYVGDLRDIKGVDTLIDALALMPEKRAVIVGCGIHKERFCAQVERLGLSDRVQFRDPLPAREALALGRVLAVPSRSESLPYIVLEAVAAQVPVVATNVGGIAEIFGLHASRLLVADRPGDLAEALIAELALSPEAKALRAAEMARFVRERFSLQAMTDAVMSAYGEAFSRARPQGLIKDLCWEV